MKHKFWDVRSYRNFSEKDKNENRLKYFNATVEESDIFFLAERDLSENAIKLIRRFRKDIESYIVIHPNFLRAFTSIKAIGNPPDIVKDMIHFSKIANVGPMAGVAGAIAEYVGRELLKLSGEVIAENGGDVFVSVKTPMVAAVDISSEIPPIKIKISPEKTPLGICTSSGKFGHSKSFGKADSVTVVSESAILSDCAATAVCNVLNSEDDIENVAELSKKIEGVRGVIAVCGGKIAIWGEVEIV